jgi:hypothetical protein
MGCPADARFSGMTGKNPESAPYPIADSMPRIGRLDPQSMLCLFLTARDSYYLISPVNLFFDRAGRACKVVLNKKGNT